MKSEPVEITYPLRAASRLTGLSPELLRAWERRYRVVEPLRTAGGTRRYRASDLERLRQAKAAVDRGLRISQVAALDPTELARYTLAADPHSPVPDLAPVLSALARLDAEGTQRLLTTQLSTLGPARFARDFALPLLREVGDRWADQRLGIASEHLATSALQSMLGTALRPNAAARLGPTMVFATPIGERHELGLQSAALTAMNAGANPIYLGTELPEEDLIGAVTDSRAAALAMSLVTIPTRQARRVIAILREGLPQDVHLWIGGAATAQLAEINGVERMENLEILEKRVTLLGFEKRRMR